MRLSNRESAGEASEKFQRIRDANKPTEILLMEDSSTFLCLWNTFTRVSENSWWTWSWGYKLITQTQLVWRTKKKNVRSGSPSLEPRWWPYCVCYCHSQQILFPLAASWGVVALEEYCYATNRAPCKQRHSTLLAIPIFLPSFVHPTKGVRWKTSKK